MGGGRTRHAQSYNLRHLFGKELEKMQDLVKLSDDSLVIISEDLGVFGEAFGVSIVSTCHTHNVCLRIREFCAEMGGGSVFFFLRGHQ